ncbi:Fungal specific transcription factor [Beauveria brongniartii RCEF 3172]|uniref:Fungal specific transcription factor n=1 Tax=Beauveria brongniartii RCEF 3172 TaxID=1081107 RepID=A0A167FZK5_9HYPO|nr:Fungal specific transcription factor [Beauveria brongniartii RCEF 3172]
MPRPKVHPSQRKRAAEACNFCRMSKKKCSATVPCTACQRRGIGHTCHLTQSPRASRSTAQRIQTSLGDGSPATEAPSAGRRASGAETVWPLDDSARCWVPPEPVIPLDPDTYQPISPSDSRTAATDTNNMESDTSPLLHTAQRETQALGRESHARMLLNLRGERGKPGVLSFVRDTVAAQIGPSQFSHNDRSETMLENEPAINGSNVATPGLIELDEDQRSSYIDMFHAATGGFLDLFSREELDQLSSVPRPERSEYRYRHIEAVASAAIAIGAQCKSSLESQQISQAYFRHAQRKAFSGMLEDLNIEIVRVFLLMAYYMLGSCRRNSAFMYLGIASRAAVSLGLHSKDTYDDNRAHCNNRLKIWMSLCNLDMTVSSLLGRPAATCGLRAEVDESHISALANHEEEDTAALFAVYGILSITTDAVENLYKKKRPSVTLIERAFARIEDWSRAIPKSMRARPDATSGDKANRQDVYRLHISCLYYFAVTLVSRPILISQLTSQSNASSITLSPLASACLDAAVFLVQTCTDAKKSENLFGSLCIIKALVFAAGLILGFDMFAKRELDFEIENAFAGAKEILDFIAEQSSQAAYYAEILGLLSSAIAEQRRKTASQGRSKLVSRLFSFGGDDATTQSDDVPFRSSEGASLPAGDRMLPDGTGHWLLGQPPTLSAELESDFIGGWDVLDLSQWDNFPFNSPRNFANEG